MIGRANISYQDISAHIVYDCVILFGLFLYIVALVHTCAKAMKPYINEWEFTRGPPTIYYLLYIICFKDHISHGNVNYLD